MTAMPFPPLRPLLAPLSLLVAAGCATGSDAPTNEGILAPSVVALSTYEAPIGTLVEVYGSNFVSPRVGTNVLFFEGTFDADDGSVHPVSAQFEARMSDPGTLRWDSFGPFRVPFGPTGNQIGIFYGTVQARVVDAEGNVTEGTDPLPIVLRVKPSIMVHELQPLSASCGGPVQRALGGASYRLRVEALGFEPANFTYTLAAPALPDFDPVTIRHVATGRFDSVGEHGDFVVPEVPGNALAYGAVLSIVATDAGGQLYGSAFAIAVHRPLEFFYNGNVIVGEVLAPAPVSACIPGGEAGRDAMYDESMSETRSRGYSLNWNESWLSSHTVSSSSSSTVGLSETNGVGFATTDGESFRWSLGSEVGGSGTIGLSDIVSIGISAKVTGMIGGETRRDVENSRDRETGLTESETTTDTASATETTGGMSGEVFRWDVSSTETVARGFGGRVLPGTYGVFYRQTLRLLRRGLLVAYNQCGAATVVGDLDFTDWTWSPDLALGEGCPPLPRSNLPEAECLVAPCLGE